MKRLLAIGFSTAFAVLIAEVLLRQFLEPSQLYSTFHSIPTLNERKRELSFWQRHRDDERMVFPGYDPELGWDTDTGGDRIRGATSIALEPPADRRRIIALGDSYTFGVDVEATETYTAYLEAAHPDLEAINMGVPGYGIDQAVLKYQLHGQRYHPEIVVLGVYVSDYERASLRFTAYAKPRFRQTPTGFVLENQPVPDVPDEVRRIQASTQGLVYVVELAANLVRKLGDGSDAEAVFFDATDAIVSHALTSLQAQLNEDQSLLVVHIPRAEAFTEVHAFRDAMSQRLLAIYTRLGIAHIDLSTALLRDASPTDVVARYYVRRDDGSIGHLSAAGHQRVAALVAEAIGAPGTQRN